MNRSLRLGLAVLSVCILCCVFISCGRTVLPEEGVYYLRNAGSVSLGRPAQSLDPAAVYESMEYTPDCFRGTYMLPGGEPALQAYRESMELIPCAGSTAPITEIPYGFHAEELPRDGSLPAISMTFLNDAGMTVTKDGSFYVYGNQLIISIPDGNDPYASPTVLTYDFSFSGISLTLYAGEKSVTLLSGMFGKATPDFFVNCYYAEEGEPPAGLYHIEFGCKGSKTRLTVTDPDGREVGNAAARLTESGLFTLTVPDGDTAVTREFVFLYAADSSMVLSDGTRLYIYSGNPYRAPDAPETEPVTEPLPDTEPVTEPVTEPEETKTEEEEIIEKQADLMADLTAALDAAGIPINADPASGVITLNASVLFDGNSAELKKEGRALLDKVIPVYASVVFNDDYRDYVSGIVVEGHIAPASNATYENGLPLSRQRAQAVKDYCTTSVSGIDAKTKKLLAAAMEAVGLSNSKPIVDARGNVDMNASRRVTFRFVITLKH